jgi:hypothetical protein
MARATKLTDEALEEILSAGREISSASLARKFGVTRQVVARYRNGKLVSRGTRIEVPPPPPSEIPANAPSTTAKLINACETVLDQILVEVEDLRGMPHTEIARDHKARRLTLLARAVKDATEAVSALHKLDPMSEMSNEEIRAAWLELNKPK